MNFLSKTKNVRHAEWLVSLAYVFFFCSVAGWIWEEIYCLIKHGFWVERGFLFGPWLPIYGVGGSLLYILWDRAIKDPLRLFLAGVAVAGVVEYFGSLFLELIFGKRWWDYTGIWFNIGGRIHLIGLMFFGIIGCAAVYFVIPPYKRTIEKMRERTRRTLCAVLLWIFSVDLIISAAVHFMT